ncbi:MAG: CPBP family intramembrane metalloprotease [Patescibacteria group bacterium]|nr:CPBP family intramembrane metalloprotease [Patescibacteria group bacterium]
MTPLQEIVCVFGLAEIAIWLSEGYRLLSYGLGAIVLVFILSYWILRPHRLKQILHPRQPDRDTARIAFATMLFWCVIALIGSWRKPGITEDPAVYASCWRSLMPGYLANAFWQQVLLLGYIVPRINEELHDSRMTAFVTACIFALIHLPNPVLVPVTAVGGGLCAYFFLEKKSFYALVLAHAVLGVSVMHFLPASWHHHSRIGPAYATWRP